MVALVAGAAGTASAQLAVTQPTEKLLVLPLTPAAGDSATSIAVSDAVRERIGQLAKYKVLVVTKAKLCEALTASGFPCDGLLDDQQARQLARFLQVQAYVTGSLTRRGGALTAHVRVIDIGSSGMAATFVINNGNPGPPQALAEAIAQRLNTIIRASEQARECTQNRQRGQFQRALAAAQKALAIDPTSAGANICIATVYEAQRMPVDSVIAASERALKGDPFNSTALENIARAWQQKGDTLKAIDAFIRQLAGDPRNTSRRLGIVQLLRQMKQYQQAVDLLDAGLAVAPADQQMLELKTRICIEGSLYRCAVSGLMAQAQHDSALLKDTTFLKTAIGAAQQAPDTQASLAFTSAAVRHFPSDPSFLKARGAAFEMAGMVDSALVVYKRTLALGQGSDVTLSLLVAKTIVDHAMYDTARAGGCTRAKDSLCLRSMQQSFAQRVDSARLYLRPGLVASDSAQRLTAAVIMLTGGSKLAQAAAYDRAYVWLDTLVQVVAQRSPADTVGPRHQVRLNASFWYGLSSVLTLSKPYQDMVKSKKCDQAKAINERLVRTRGALQYGERVHPATVRQMLGFLVQYERQMPRVKQAFKCSNF
ncbi:MAG: tetratricopeptide repeat protein [Burkholderiales bacterium]